MKCIAILLLAWSGLSLGETGAMLVDVSGQVLVKRSGFVFNRSTETFDTTSTLTNSLIPVSAPLSLVVTEISSPFVSLMNTSNLTSDGKPYISVPVAGGILAPGASVKTLLKFSNPQKVAFTFKTLVLAHVDEQITDQSITTVIDSMGGVIELPGKALLDIPPASVASTAIQMSIIDLPEFDQLTSELGDEIKPLPIHRLKIKSSANLLDRILLRMELPKPIPSNREVALYAVDDEGAEGDGLDIAYVGGFFCDDNRNSLCAWIHPSAFSPVPLGLLDPVIKIAAATIPKIESAYHLFITKDIKPDKKQYFH